VHNTDPLLTDTDGDGKSFIVFFFIGRSLCSNIDSLPIGLSDYDEIVTCTGCNATLVDTDGDGLTGK